MDLPEIIAASADRVVMELVSPGFGTTAPDVRHAERIPAEVLRQMAAAWGTRRYGESAVRVHLLRDVFVVGEGLVFDRDLRVHGVSMTQYTVAEAGVLQGVVRAAVAAGRVETEGGMTLLCQKRGMGNFGHWLIELLPMAHVLLPWLGAGGCRVLAPGLAGAMGGVVADSLGMLGVGAGQIRFSGGEPVHFRELLVVEGLTAHGYLVSPLVMGAMDALMAGVAADGEAPLWVSRRGAHRCLAAEGEVEAALRERGWRVLAPEGMRLREQIAAFRGAAGVAGVHGAGLTGIVFAPGGTRVTSFAPAGMPDTFFWLLSMLRGHRYVEVRAGHERGWDGDTVWDAALEVSVGEVLEVVG